MDRSSFGWIGTRLGLGGRERMASYAKLTKMKIAFRVIALEQSVPTLCWGSRVSKMVCTYIYLFKDATMNRPNQP